MKPHPYLELHICDKQRIVRNFRAQQDYHLWIDSFGTVQLQVEGGEQQMRFETAEEAMLVADQLMALAIELAAKPAYVPLSQPLVDLKESCKEVTSAEHSTLSSREFASIY